MTRHPGYFPTHKGVADFNKLRKKGKIEAGTTIRVYDYGTTIDPHYVVDNSGRLISVRGENQTPLEPKSILSKSAAPEGWIISGYRPDLL